jgi:hypothetical protein
MLLDDLLPTYDVSNEVAVVVEADVPTTWAALMAVDLIELGRRRPLIGVLGGVRILPELVAHLLHGETPPAAPKRLVLRDTASAVGGGWVLLGERPNDEIALGLVGKFWRPVIDYAQVAADDFRDYAEPGFAKTIYSLSVRPLEDGRKTLLSAVMRTATTDEHARRWFWRYWTFGVGSGAHVLAAGLAEAARDAAEAQAGQHESATTQPVGGDDA